MNKIQIIFLGKPKHQLQNKTEKNKENEIIKWYKVKYNSDCRVGDIITTTITQQYSFLCPNTLEIYKIHEFIEEDGFIADDNFIEMYDYIEKYCNDLTEIYE